MCRKVIEKKGWNEGRGLTFVDFECRQAGSFEREHEFHPAKVTSDASHAPRYFQAIPQPIDHDFPAFLHERLLFEFFVGSLLDTNFTNFHESGH